MEVSANFLSRPEDIERIKAVCSDALSDLGAYLIVSGVDTTHAPADSRLVPVRVRAEEKLFGPNKERLNEIFNSITQIVGNEPVMRRSFLQSVTDKAAYVVALPDGTCPKPLKNSQKDGGKIRASYWLTSGVLIRVSPGRVGGLVRVDVTYIRAYRGGVGVQHLASGSCDKVSVSLKIVDHDGAAKIGGLQKFERAILAATNLLTGEEVVASW